MAKEADEIVAALAAFSEVLADAGLEYNEASHHISIVKERTVPTNVGRSVRLSLAEAIQRYAKRYAATVIT